MSPRRKFLVSISTAATFPMLSSVLSAGGRSVASTIDVPISDAELKRQMAGKLATELNDEAIAGIEMAQLFDIGFTWDLPTASASQIDHIIAYSFGNRPNVASGNTPTNGQNQAALPDPGPVNEALADAVYQFYKLRPVRVFAQWEIARFLRSKYALQDLVSIEPVTASDGTITYLSTDGVAAAIIAKAGGAGAMGTVGVVAHRDHAKRCVETSRLAGMQAYAGLEIALPTLYDPQSGQPWTRRRDIYLVHDMSVQFNMLKAKLIATSYPKG